MAVSSYRKAAGMGMSDPNIWVWMPAADSRTSEGEELSE
jgi:hypothetical protein